MDGAIKKLPVGLHLPLAPGGKSPLLFQLQTPMDAENGRKNVERVFAQRHFVHLHFIGYQIKF